MALTYSKNGNNPEAISIVKSILEKDSQNAKAYFDLGKYQKMEKNSEDSAVSFKKACELGEKKACEETGEKKKKK